MSEVWADESKDREIVLVEVREGVAIVRLNRPERLNAWTPDMGTLYFDTLDRLAEDTRVKAILVTGEGRAFCAGADVSGLGGMADKGRSDIERETRPYWYPIEIGKPVVAAINGVCYGVGLQQALFCDVRFVADNVRICTAYAKRGLMGEVGITWILERIVGVGAAMDLLLSAREIGPQEAKEIGLATKIVPADQLLDEAFAYCKAMADTCAPWSMRTIKKQLYTDLMTNLPSAFDRSQMYLEEALASEDFAEGVRAVMEKRKPDFPGLSPELAKLGPWPAD